MAGMAPSPSGFLAFIRGIVGINTTVLPDTAPVLDYAYQAAIDIVLLALNVIPSQYTYAVYNLGADNLINWAVDTPPQTFFTDLRKQLGINAFAAGVVTSAADSSTSDALVTPEFFKNLTMANLQNLKTPYGRQYLAIAQSSGTIWGLN